WRTGHDARGRTAPARGGMGQRPRVALAGAGPCGGPTLRGMNRRPARGRLGLMAIINPMVGWIWFSTGVVALGGLLAMFPAGRRREAETEAEITESAPARGLSEEVV
ncbi:MAG: hypothetical protein KY432_11175, partial [Acidobacteria bacterium]|nr:hypothetical protein [Acidobacteriota bacterium]